MIFYLDFTGLMGYYKCTNSILFAQIKASDHWSEICMNNLFEVCYFVRKKANDSWKLENISLPWYDLTFILSGEAVYVSSGETFLLKAGDAVFIPAGSDRYALTKEMECVAFNFYCTQPPFPAAAKIHWGLDSQLIDCFHSFDRAWISKSEIDTLKCSGLFYLIISRILELQHFQQSNPYVTKIRDYLQQHYTEKVTVQKVADHIRLNEVYCGALFSRETGETILNYTNQLRITKAAELLKYSTDSITEIAEEVGFEELYYFSRVFKKIIGVSPKEYRRMHQ